MALQFITNESGFINYLALSTDIASSKIPGAVLVGRLVFLTDSGVTKVILPNLELADFAMPTAFSGTISVGAVSTGISAAGVDGLGNFISILSAPGSVNEAPLASFPYAFNGTSWDKVRIGKISKDVSAVTVTTITTLWTPASGKKFRLMGGTLSCSTAVSILFEDNIAGVTIFRTPKLLVDTPYTFEVNGGQGKLSATADNILKATSSAAGVITGTLWGTEE
jgi:hypothetical protein